jgi:serine/threonine protein kinase
VIHGDLKPKNVLISDEGVAQLCDFGLVSVAEWGGPTGINTSTPFAGTMRYEAYELLGSKENRDPRPTFASDVYAFGCVAYEVREQEFLKFTVSNTTLLSVHRKEVSFL